MVKKGDLVKITSEDYNVLSRDVRYKNGDVFEVAIACNDGDVYIDMNGETPVWLIKDEYEVI